MSYAYLIPKFFGSPWDRPGRTVSTVKDVDEPRVGIYCPHELQPWLVGSFTISYEVFEATGAISWTWDTKFMTGDGYVIALNPQSPEKNSAQALIGEGRATQRREDSKKSSNAAALEAVEAGDYDRMRRLNKLIEESDASTRTRVPFSCPTCRLRRVFRDENLQGVVSLLWSSGFREVGLREFISRVDRRS